MITVDLPELVAGRDMADDIVDRLGRLAGETVVLNSGKLVNVTESFATRLVERLLDDGGAAELVVVDAPERFQDYLTGAAELINAAGHLTLVAQ